LFFPNQRPIFTTTINAIVEDTMKKKMLNSLIKYGKLQSFQPNLLSIFLNPFFFIRKGLFKGIKTNAPVLTGVLLDFGCGRKPYQNLFNVQKYIGIDIEQSGHLHELSQIDVYYDGKHIPFENEYFDSVFCSEVLEHVFNIDEILAEINRVMKPEAMFLFTVPFIWGEHEKPYDFGRYTSFGIHYIMKKHGFEVQQLGKTCHFAEVIVQLCTLYIYSLFQTKSRYLNTIFTVIFISPINLIGLIIAWLLPKNYDLYHNNIVLAKKVGPSTI
jgi:SAM-dependent methyltransferase